MKKSVGLDPETTRVKLRLVDGNEDGVAEHKAYDDLMICVMAKPSSITGFFDSLFASTALKARSDDDGKGQGTVGDDPFWRTRRRRRYRIQLGVLRPGGSGTIERRSW